MLAADSNWTDVLTAIGTVSAVVVALVVALSARWHEASRRPELRLIYDPRLDLQEGINVRGREEHRVRMRVSNEWGRRSAQDVEVLAVFLAEGRKTHHGWVLRTTVLSGPVFAWSGASSSDGHPVTRVTIPPGVVRSFDLLTIREPRVSDWEAGLAEEGKTPARAVIEVIPSLDESPRGLVERDDELDKDALDARRYQLTIALTARDTDAVYYSFEVEFDGKWWGAENVGSHLDVGEPVISSLTQMKPGVLDPRDDLRLIDRLKRRARKSRLARYLERRRRERALRIVQAAQQRRIEQARSQRRDHDNDV